MADLACWKKVPEDKSVVGFGNTDASRIVRPALSTIVTNQKAVAEAWPELIEAMIARKTTSKKHLVTSMVIRNTTR